MPSRIWRPRNDSRSLLHRERLRPPWPRNDHRLGTLLTRRRNPRAIDRPDRPTAGSALHRPGEWPLARCVIRDCRGNYRQARSCATRRAVRFSGAHAGLLDHGRFRSRIGGRIMIREAFEVFTEVVGVTLLTATI